MKWKFPKLLSFVWKLGQNGNSLQCNQKSEVEGLCSNTKKLRMFPFHVGKSKNVKNLSVQNWKQNVRQITEFR